MQIVIDIPDYKIPEKQDIISVDIHFIDGEVCECTYPYIVFPKGHGRLIDEKEVYKKFYCRCLAGVAKEVLEETSTIIEADGGDTETWNGYHGQVTAPKGTFKRIYADADGGDAE